VDNQEIPLERNPLDDDFKTGVKYSVSDVKLSQGNHNVIFKASDSHGTPSMSFNMDEQVKVKEDTSKGRLTSMLIIAAIAIVVLIALMIGATILMFRRKAKKDAETLEQITPEVDTKVSELMCTGCGSVLPEGTLKCPKCGRDLKKVEAKHEKEFKCTTCGAANPVGATKCSACEKDFTAKVQDTTRMAEQDAVADDIVADAEMVEAESAWQEPIEAEKVSGDGEVEQKEAPLEGKDVEELSDDDFDDGLSFEGFDEL
jgi:ribosomal protein L40E